MCLFLLEGECALILIIVSQFYFCIFAQFFLVENSCLVVPLS